MADSFVFYKSFVDAIDTLPAQDQLMAYRAISHYATTGEEPDASMGIAYTIFLMARPQLDANKSRRENGEKGGRPKKNTDATEEEKPMVIESENHRLPEEKPNVNVNENVNEKEKVKRKTFVPPTLEEVQEYCKEKQLNVEPKQFLDYFTTSNWVDSKGQKVKNWKQKLLTWNSFRSSRASPQKQNSFSKGIMQQDYDMDAIERAILS